MHPGIFAGGVRGEDVIPSCRDDVPEAVCEFEEPGWETPIHGLEPVGEDAVETDGGVRLYEGRSGVDLEDQIVRAVEDR